MKYIYGLNKSGKSIINYLNKIHEIYYCWDDNLEIRKRIIKHNDEIKLVKPNKINLDLITESFITPGISLNNKKLKFLKDNKIKLYRDLELYSRLTQDKKIIAITGTNGKSTTSKLISDMMNYSNIKNFLGGNIGTPLLDYIEKKKVPKYHVIELSSFQLESFKSFNPYISILLNISADHMDRYDQLEDYIKQKEKIINLDKNSFNIVCVDDKKTYNIYKKYRRNVIPISINPIKKGLYFNKNSIIDNFFPIKKNLYIKSIASSLYGGFNIENIMAAYVVARILNIKIENFLYIIKNFKGLPYRLERIHKDHNLEIINNSKATNLNASLKSIAIYDNISLILGGRTEEKNFKKILDFKKKINKVYLIGEVSIKIYNQLKNEIDCEICHNLLNATNKIFLDVKNKSIFQTILFSPACTSFDQFKNFEERGEYFTKLIIKKFNE